MQIENIKYHREFSLQRINNDTMQRQPICDEAIVVDISVVTKES